MYMYYMFSLYRLYINSYLFYTKLKEDQCFIYTTVLATYKKDSLTVTCTISYMYLYYKRV